MKTKPTETAIVNIETSQNDITLPQSVDHDMLKEIKSTAIKRVATRNEQKRQRALQAEQARNVENERIANLEEQQGEYDRQYESELAIYESDKDRMETESDATYAAVKTEYALKVEQQEKADKDKQLRLQEEADEQYAQAMSKYETEYALQEQGNKSDQLRLQAAANKTYESEQAGYEAKVTESKVAYDAEIQRCHGLLPQYYDRLGEWCEEPETPFLAGKMTKYLLDKVDAVTDNLMKAFSGSKPTPEKVVKYLFNQIIYPQVSKEEMDIEKEKEWCSRPCSSGSGAINISGSQEELHPNSLINELKTFVYSCKRNYGNPHRYEPGVQDFLFNQLAESIHEITDADIDPNIKKLLHLFCQRLKTEARSRNPYVTADGAKSIEDEIDNIGFKIFFQRTKYNYNSNVPCDADFSDKQSVAVFIAGILEQLSHKKLDPPVPQYKVPDLPVREVVEMKKVTLEKPEKKEVELQKTEIEKPERKPISLKKPERKIIDVPSQIQVTEEDELAHIPQLNMTNFQGLDTLKEHLRIHMIRRGIQNGINNEMGDPVTARRREWLNDADNAIFGNHGELSMQDSLKKYKRLPGFGFWGLLKTKNNYEQELESVRIDGRVEYLFDMAEWIYRNYCLGYLYVTKGTEQQRKAGEVLIEMMMILKDSLAEMALEIEGKIGFGDDNSSRLQAIVEGLATLGDDRTLQAEIEKAEQFSEDVAVMQEAHAEVSKSVEDDFDDRLEELVEGARIAEADSASTENDVIQADAEAEAEAEEEEEDAEHNMTLEAGR